MSDANVKLVQSLYDAFKRGDIATIVNALTPDVDWQVHRDPKDFPTIGRCTGPEGAQDFFRTVAQHLDAGEFTPHEFHANGESVTALGRYRWTVRATASRPAANGATSSTSGTARWPASASTPTRPR